VEVELPADPPPPVAPDPSVAIEVVHEDRALIIVDKPAGLIVHPGAGRSGSTLADGLLARYPELVDVGPDHRPGIVHRLDRGTSGLLVVARTEQARTALVRALAERRIERGYQTVVWGRVGSARGIVDAPIGRSRRDPTKRAVVEDGREARTHYEVEARYDAPDQATLLACRLETGRTHQIRVHLAAIDHPVVADTAYGGARAEVGLDRPFLHARRLGLDHPVTGQAMLFTSELPLDLTEALDRFS
jgi:23S rRNA pseudouridine1911/1915/1917 synthase